MLRDSFTSYESLPRFPLTRFIGRKREIADIKRLLNSTRLLTLWGPMGCGKSRLAFQVVREMMENSSEDVLWIELDALANGVELLQKIALQLHMSEPSNFQSPEQLLPALTNGSRLLILDNCDHIITECSQLIEILLPSCPRLRILLTSREALSIAGETVWQVSPLPVPDPQHLSPFKELTRYEAIELFLVRTMDTQPSFRCTEEKALAVVRICRHLNGIPLAIEMAALRIKVLSLEQIVAQLDNCCQLLTSGYRTALPRHQSLSSTIDWSYSSLSEKERRALYLLSDFTESFTLEEAQVRCEGNGLEEGELLSLLTRLVDKSLLLIPRQHSDIRYQPLEMVRQYSRNKFSAQKVVQLPDTPEKTLPSGEPLYLERSLSKASRLVHFSGGEGAEPVTDDRTDIRTAGEACALRSEVAYQGASGLKSANSSVRGPGKKFPAIRIFAFGQVEIYRDKNILTPADWKYTKARELLFYLLCNPFKTKEQIGLALWPDASSDQLRSSFHSALHHLRKALGSPEWITFEHGLYAFHYTLDYWFDLEAFEYSLEQAKKLRLQSPPQAIQYLEKGVNLYRGDFLASLSIGNWYMLRQRDLYKEYLNALFTLGELFFAVAQYERAANTYRRIIISDNLEEAAHRELMRCYVRQGKRNQAMRHYQELLNILESELDIEPSLDTRNLFARVSGGKEV